MADKDMTEILAEIIPTAQLLMSFSCTLYIKNCEINCEHDGHNSSSKTECAGNCFRIVIYFQDEESY